jgi:ATP-dependent Clp protease ATP-binding subunit ClpC
MPKLNVYLSDELAAAVKESKLPVSAICQTALERAVRDATALRGPEPDGDEDQGRGMLHRFTQRARGSIEHAQSQAKAHAHGYVGTEHVLLGILDEGGNLAVKVLEALEIEADDLRAELEASMGPPGAKSAKRARFTPVAKAALGTAVQEALRMGHNYIGCEHLLLALVAEEEGLASQVLRRMGVELRTTRMAVTAELSGYLQAKQTAAAATATASATTLEEILRRLEAIEGRLPG